MQSILLLSFALVFSKAAAMPLSTIEHSGAVYSLDLANGKLLAKKNGQILEGKLEKRLGDFSHWVFRLNQNGYEGFELLINEKLSKVLYQKNDLDAGGPFLEAISPDSKMVLFDYGTGPMERGLEVRNSEGKVLLKDTYLHEATWRNNAFEYGRPTLLPPSLNEETKACENFGTAWSVEVFRFDGIKKVKSSHPPKVKCSN